MGRRYYLQDLILCNINDNLQTNNSVLYTQYTVCIVQIFFIVYDLFILSPFKMQIQLSYLWSPLSTLSRYLICIHPQTYIPSYMLPVVPSFIITRTISLSNNSKTIIPSVCKISDPES